MNWGDAMKANANVANGDRSSPDASGTGSAASNSWDPHEVWLTRVKQPRELAARRVTAGDVSQPGKPQRREQT